MKKLWLLLMIPSFIKSMDKEELKSQSIRISVSISIERPRTPNSVDDDPEVTDVVSVSPELHVCYTKQSRELIGSVYSSDLVSSESDIPTAIIDMTSKIAHDAFPKPTPETQLTLRTARQTVRKKHASFKRKSFSRDEYVSKNPNQRTS